MSKIVSKSSKIDSNIAFFDSNIAFIILHFKKFCRFLSGNPDQVKNYFDYVICC